MFAFMGMTMLWLTATTSNRGDVTEQWHFRVEANVVVGIFAHLSLVDPDQLRVFRRLGGASKG